MRSLVQVQDCPFQTPFWIIWGFSSVGRAPALQAGCQRFESAILHVRYLTMDYRVKYQIERAIDALQQALKYNEDNFNVDGLDANPYTMYYDRRSKPYYSAGTFM